MEALWEERFALGKDRSEDGWAEGRLPAGKAEAVKDSKKRGRNVSSMMRESD